MGSRDITCDIDAFASSLSALIGDIPESCGEACEKAVRQSIRKIHQYGSEFFVKYQFNTLSNGFLI